MSRPGCAIRCLGRLPRTREADIDCFAGLSTRCSPVISVIKSIASGTFWSGGTCARSAAMARPTPITLRDARFTIPTSTLLAKVVDLIDGVPMEERDTKAISTSTCSRRSHRLGKTGSFAPPRHIIRLMVEMVAPTPTDVICDPAAGTCGFLVAAGEYLRERHPEVLRDARLREHFHHGMFHGFDFDNTMLRIGSMNMLLHGVENPDVRYRDSVGRRDSARNSRLVLGARMTKFLTKPLCDVAELNPRFRTQSADDAPVAFVPMAAVEAESGIVRGAEERRYSVVRKRYTPFKCGDLLVAKITPCFENGKIGQATINESQTCLTGRTRCGRSGVWP